MDRRRLLCVVVSSSVLPVVLAAILAVRASAAGIAYAAEEVPAWTGPVHLELPGAQEPRLTRHSFTFARNLDYCGPRGTTEKVSLREVPVSAKYPHPSAVLTVIVAFPSFERPSVCPPLVYSYETLRVRTKRPAPSLWFYDGSFDPPRRIWPERAVHPR